MVEEEVVCVLCVWGGAKGGDGWALRTVHAVAKPSLFAAAAKPSLFALRKKLPECAG